MNKLNNLRDEKALKLCPVNMMKDVDGDWRDVNLSDRISMKQGWDAHEALNLPVLFAEWCRYGKYEAYKNIIRDCTSRGLSSEDTTKELYDYWINNIYTP